MDPDIDPLTALAAAEPYALSDETLIIAVILAILWITTSILWFFLPFAVFGVKGRLDRLIAETKRQNELLAQALDKTAERREPSL